MWTKVFQVGVAAYGNSVQQTADEGFIVAGKFFKDFTTDSDIYLIKTDANGHTLWTKTIGDSLAQVGNCIQQTSDSGYIMVGETQSFTSSVAVYLVRLAAEPGGIEDMTKGQLPKTFILSQNIPNPFNPVTSIKFTIPKSEFVKLIIYDILGREIVRPVNQELRAGNYEVNWDATNYASGIYFYRLKAGDFVETRKLILLR